MSAPAQNLYFAYQAAQDPRDNTRVIDRKKNFLTAPLQRLQSWQESLVKFVFSIICMIARLPFNIGIRILDLFERGIRYLVWINIKSAVSWVNFLYRCLAFFRFTYLINLIDSIAKQNFRSYSSIDFDNVEQPSRFSLILRKKNYDLINIDKFEKRIKTPILFITRDPPYVQNGQIDRQPKANQNHPNIQQPQGLQRQGDLQCSIQDRNANPQLVKLSRSHERIKYPEGSLSSPRNPRMTVQIPNRTQNQGSQTRIIPDRDISPERYMKRIPRIGQDTFSQEQNNVEIKPSFEGFQPNTDQLECQIGKYPFLQDQIAQRTKQQLQEELSYLKANMQQLIDDNNNYIQELEEWLKKKSQTVTQTRKENIQLLQEMKKLQNQNIKKTKSLKLIQQQITSIQNEVHQEQTKRNEVSSRIISLNDQIRDKSIELMQLKQKINQNYKQMEENQQRQKADTKLNRSADQSTLQNSIVHEDFEEEQEMVERLREEEEKTNELADKVQRLIREQTKKVQDTKIEMEPIEQIGEKERKGAEQKRKSKQLQAIVLSSDGKTRITMRRE